MTGGTQHRWILALLCLLLAAHAVWLWIFSEAVYAGPDAAGYFTPARLIATEGTASLHPTSPAEFLGYHWLDGGDGRFYVRYPLGLPVILAAVATIGGPFAAQSFSRLLATLSVLVFFLLARRSVRPDIALAGTLVFATFPVLNEQALLGFAHIPVTVFLLCGLLLVELWLERPRAWLALLGGACLGILPTLRYPAAVLGMGVVAYAILGARSEGQRRQIPFLLLGATAPVGAVLLYNQLVFGGPLRTAYDLSREQAAFGVSYLLRNGLGYAKTLARNAGFTVLLGTLGITMMILGRDRGRGLLLISLIATTTAVYAAYYWPSDIRFLLPTLPLFLLAALSFVDSLADAPQRRAVLTGYVALHLLVAVPDGVTRMRQLGRRIDVAAVTVDGVEHTVPRGAVIVAPHAVQTLLDPYGRWKLAEWSLLWPFAPFEGPPGVPPPFGPQGERQASPFQPDKAKALRAAYGGLDQPTTYRAVLRDLFAWAERDTIYWISTPEWIDAMRPHLEKVARFDLIGQLPPAESDHGLPRAGVRPAFWLPELPLNVYAITPAAPAPSRLPSCTNPLRRTRIPAAPIHRLAGRQRASVHGLPRGGGPTRD